MFGKNACKIRHLASEIAYGAGKFLSMDGRADIPGNGWREAEGKFQTTGGMTLGHESDKPVASSASLRTCELASQLFT
ncbi:hypothetical protein [Pseudomonas sp. W4I3]|uniref:hypothetical protein n=1 Tax=Pseudomonas sp. W4I3 TaxID=3042294 RepID=UPI00277E6720|nr:hypothetical protein [Pseudomonas sp. W4I3]MDQ0737816.1 hypothetical protein [Pseudomonas sp. W4I3]